MDRVCDQPWLLLKRKKIAQEAAKQRCGARERERYIPSPPCCSFPIAADCIRRLCQCPGESTEGFRIIAYPGERLHLFAVADRAVVFPLSRFIIEAKPFNRHSKQQRQCNDHKRCSACDQCVAAGAGAARLREGQRFGGLAVESEAT